MRSAVGFLLMLTVAVGCSSVRVSYDVDRETNFNRYKTYGYSEDAKKLKGGELYAARVVRAVDAEMAKRGFTQSSTPDVLIDLHAKVEDKKQAVATTNYNTMGMGYRPWRYGYGPGFSTTQIQYIDFLEGTLFINMVDSERQHIVWQGRGTKQIDEDATPEIRDKNVNQVVAAIFEKFPIQPPAKK